MNNAYIRWKLFGKDTEGGMGNLNPWAKFWSNYSESLTRPKLPPKGSGLEEKSPAISGKSRLAKHYNLGGEVSFNCKHLDLQS